MRNNFDITASSYQDSSPRRYYFRIKLFSMAVFLYVIIAYLNEMVFKWYQLPDGSYPFWLSRWTEYFVVVIFGAWRFRAEKNLYTKKRIATLTFVVGIFWWIMPGYLRLPEYSVGNLHKDMAFPNLHTPGTVSFFVVLLLVLLFGRRIICGWGCPCVGIRETVGFPYRINTIRTKKGRHFRHIKWIFLTLYLAAAVLIVTHSEYSNRFFGIFCGIIIVPYFLSMILSPLLGNRAYCRFICPFGALFGILNRIGFYAIKVKRDTCNNCHLCETVCDMGIPIASQIEQSGQITTIEECMGCGRCVISCPQKSLKFSDARDLLRPAPVAYNENLSHNKTLQRPDKEDSTETIA